MRLKTLLVAAALVVMTAASVNVAFAQDNATGVNKFNRLFKGASNANLPQAEDGIHDPENIGTLALQPPREAFSDLPKSRAGNRVDWVKALNDNMINPRADRLDENKKMTVLDLNIIREVKGSMPDVVYPHKQHTQWLECRNCHPKIFIPKKGANKISMAGILMGQYCGKCHGKVAFPISECRFCHSKPKSPEYMNDLRSKRKSPKVATLPASAAPVAAAKAVPVQQSVQIAAPSQPAKAEPKEDLSDKTKAQLMERGAAVFEENCSGCHGANGEGVPDTFPALKGSKVATGPLAKHINIVLSGVEGTAMQSWKDDLSVADIAAVITYERNAWGNNTDDVVQPSRIKSAK